jgi:hypothetical protein
MFRYVQFPQCLLFTTGLYYSPGRQEKAEEEEMNGPVCMVSNAFTFSEDDANGNLLLQY